MGEKLKRPDWTYGFWYRKKARLLHRFDLHHTRTWIVEDGAEVIKCDWCGLSKVERPWITPSSPPKPDFGEGPKPEQMAGS